MTEIDSRISSSPADTASPVRTGHSRRSVLKGGAGLLSGVFVSGLALPGTVRPAFAMEQVVQQLGWIKSIQFGGHFAAIDQGYFAEEGIEAEFLPGGPGTDTTSVVASGQAMITDGDVEGVIRARIAGIPVKAFAAIMQKAPGAIMSLSSKPIKTLEDLVGKTVALPNDTRPQVASLMTAAGLDPASVNFVPVGTDPGILAAGQVDGYYGWATNQGVMLKMRGVDIEVAYMNDLGLPGYAGVLYATDETIETKSDLLVKWLRAEIKGWQWFLDNPEAMAKLMVETYGQRGLDLEAQTVEAGVYKDFIPVGDAAANGLLWIEPAVFETGIAFQVAAGAMKEGDVKVDDVVTQALIKAAHGK